MMIWHICKKDLRLLWPLAVLGALLQAWTANFVTERHTALADLPMPFVATILVLTVVAAGVLIVIAVQHETPASMTQDWLVRPISRVQLLSAKLLFAGLAIHGPMLAIDVMNGLRVDLPLFEAVLSGFARCTLVFLCFTLPLTALAACTKTLTATILWTGGLVAFVIAAMATGLAPLGGLVPLAGSGMTWMLIYMFFAVPFGAALIMLPLAYFRRNILLSRQIAIGAAALFALWNFLPWEPAYALQKALSRHPDAAAHVKLALAPASAPFMVPKGETPASYLAGSRRVIVNLTDAAVMFLPLRIEGLPEGSVLQDDRTLIRLISADGAVLHEGPTGVRGAARRLVRRNLVDVRQPAGGGAQETYQLLLLPRELYDRIKDQPLHIEMEHALTLFARDKLLTLPAAAGEAHAPGLGICRTVLAADGRQAELRCLTGGAFGRPPCASLTLDPPADGNSEKRLCQQFYAPVRPIFPFGAVSWFVFEAEIQSPSARQSTPVPSGSVQEARLTFETFEPEAHFVRTLSASNVRLSDWIAE